MDSAAWKVEEISGFDFNIPQQLIPIAIMYLLFQFFLGLCMVSVNDFGTWFGGQDIPTFRFSEFSFMSQSIFIIRVDLHRQIIMGVDDFGQQWKDITLLIPE